MMNPTRLKTWISLLLVPCLIAEPALPAAITAYRSDLPVSQVYRSPSDSVVYTAQALSLPYDFVHEAKGKMAFALRKTASYFILPKAAHSDEWKPASSASMSARWVWNKMAELSWRRPSKYFFMTLLVALAPAVVFHELFHVIGAWKLIRSGDVRVSPWGFLNGTPLLMHAGYAGVHPVEPWYVRALGPFFNLFVAVAGMTAYFYRVPLTLALFSGHLFIPSNLEEYGFYNLGFLLIEIAVGLAMRHGDLFTLMARFRFDSHDTRVLLSVKEGQKQLRNYILKYIRQGRVDFPPHVGLLRIDPEFGEIIDRRVPPELAAQIRQRIMAMMVEFLREQPVLHDTLLAATESNDEVLLLMPSGVSGTIKEAHIKNALQIIHENWIRNGYAIYDLEDRMSGLAPSQFARLARQLKPKGIYLWRNEENTQSMALALRPAIYAGKLGYVEPDEKATLNPDWISVQIAQAMKSFAMPVDVTPEFLEQRQLTSYPIVFSAVMSSLSRAEDLIGMELMNKSREAHGEIPEDHWKISEYLHTLRSQGMLSEEQHANLIDSGLVRILRTLRKSTYRQPDQLRRVAGITLNAAEEPMLAIRVEELHSQLPTINGNNVVITAPDTREKFYRILSESDLKNDSVPLATRVRFDPQQGNRHAELSLRTWLVRLSEGGRIQRMITRAMLMAYFAVVAKPSFSFGQAMVAGLDSSQARLYVQLLERVFPSDTERIVGIHNPMPEDLNLPKSYGRPDNNGIAVLQSVRSVYEFLGQKLQPGRNYFRLAGSSLLNGKIHMAVFCGGTSSRAAPGTPGGKAPAVLGFTYPGSSLGGPATMAHLLSAIGVSMGQAMLNANHANNSKHLDMGALGIIYGDNVTQIDPAQLQEFFRVNPDATEGLTIALRAVPWYESVKWGVAHLDRSGRILRFFEKPGGPSEDILTKDEINILMQYIDSKEEALQHHGEALKGRNGILERLRNHLNEKKLLVSLPGQEEPIIYMNAGFGLLSGESLIRYMKLMGADIHYDAENGDYYVNVDPDDPLESAIQPIDHALVRTNLESVLSKILLPAFQAMDPQNTTITRDAVLEILKDQQKALIMPEQGEKKLIKALKEHRRALQEQIERFSDSDQEQIRDAISETIWQIGQDVSFYEGFVVAGMNLDFFGDVVPAMAGGMAKGDFIFSQKKVMDLAKKAPHISEFLEAIKPRLSSEDPAVCDVAARELYVEMVRCRVEVDGDRLPMEGYQALAGAYWRLRIWQTLREKNIGATTPQLYGYVDPRVSTAWLDSGALFEFIQNMTGVTKRGQEVANAFEVQPKVVTNISSPITAHWAAMDPDLDKPENFSSLGYIASSYLGGTGSQPSRDVHLGEQSAVFNAQIPWGFKLGAYRSVFEGIVTRNETPGKRPVYVVSGMIQHNIDKTPGDTDSFMGNKLSNFFTLNHLKKQDGSWEDGLWNEPREFQSSGEQSEGWKIPAVTRWSSTFKKQVAFNAKLFPGLSYRLMQASFEGKNPEALHAAAQDNLDWALFNQMSDIWSWLQGDLTAFEEDGSPKAFFTVWQQAREAGRLFSMEDMHTKRASDQLLERRMAILKLVKERADAATNIRNEKFPDSPYWISGLDPRKVPPLEEILSAERHSVAYRRTVKPIVNALWVAVSFLSIGAHKISNTLEQFFAPQFPNSRVAHVSPRESHIGA